MRKTLLVAVQSALGELGQSRPQVVVSSTDKEVQQMFSLLIALCEELSQTYNWQELQTSHTFQAEAGQDSYKLPTDCLRIVNSTLWDTSTQTPISGPLTDAGWAAVKNGLGATPTDNQYRLQGQSLKLLPTPQATKTIAYDYISAKYVINAGDGVLKTDFANDADGFVFDDRLVINGLKLKYMETKGFDTTTYLSDFNRSLEAVMSSNRSASPLNLGSSQGFRLLGVNNLPNGNWK